MNSADRRTFPTVLTCFLIVSVAFYLFAIRKSNRQDLEVRAAKAKREAYEIDTAPLGSLVRSSTSLTITYKGNSYTASSDELHELTKVFSVSVYHPTSKHRGDAPFLQFNTPDGLLRIDYEGDSNWVALPMDKTQKDSISFTLGPDAQICLYRLLNKAGYPSSQ